MSDLDTRMVLKRTGKAVKFNTKKIHKAIAGANKDANNEMTNGDIMACTLQVDILFKSEKVINVEDIQDCVEETLMKNNFCKTAKAYVLWRQKHAERRKASQDLMSSYSDLLFADAADMDLKRDNANINTDATMGIMLKLGAEGAKCWANHYALPEEFAKPHLDNYYHLHDLDFSYITWNCTQVDLLKLFKGGFSTGHGFLREPNSIRAAASLACVAIQSSQNDFFGGQSINALDYALAPYVKKSFKKHYRSNLAKAITFRHAESDEECHIIDSLYEIINTKSKLAGSAFPEMSDSDPGKVITALKKAAPDMEGYIQRYVTIGLLNGVWEFAYDDTANETAQAMEAMIHNFNTLHSRAGAQVPFSSINFGTDTSIAGRLVIKYTLEAINRGLGHGETAIFPIAIFKIKTGVNYNPGDPNYDLFQYACKVSAKRLYPNFISEDAPYNACFYEDGDYNTEAAVMGCRTKVMSNVNGRAVSGGRGNFSFTTINLPKLALEAKGDIKKFWKLYDKYIKLSKDYLEYRYNIIVKKHGKNYPFSIGERVAFGSDNIGPEDTIEDALKQCSISIGFCGLAECLVALTGHHHGETEEARKLGFEIIKHLRDMTDKFTKQTHMNWSTFATPAESTAGSFAKSNQRDYGVIPGVTDRQYLTNSFHVPVYYKIKAMDKIKIEAPYHDLCNAGSISYIEMDGDPTKNVKAFEAIVRAMHDADMSYFSVNHPVDRDPVCGYTGIIQNECPHCHRREDGHYSFTMNKV